MISKILDSIRKAEDCSLIKPAGMPQIKPEHLLPADLKQFYSEQGGAIFFGEQHYPWRIVSPEKLKPALEAVISGLYAEDEEYADMADFYVIAEDFNGDYLAINLSEGHNGKVVDAFHETFGVPEETPIVSDSFTDLLTRLLVNEGKYPYWMENRDDFKDWFD